jgi:hypothetical protein
MNFSSIDLDKIEFSELYQNNNIRYYLIFYNNNNDLLVKIDNIFISSIEETNNNILIKFKICNEFYNYIKNIEKKVIDFIYQNKNTIYQSNNLINSSLIKNLFFSNIDLINDEIFFNISVKKKLTFKYNEYVDIIIKINGIWIYEEMLGISYIIL